MEASEKYLQALRELYLILKYTNKIPLKDFCIAKGLNTNAGYQLVKGGIIKNEGSRGISAKFKWNTIPPNIKMAEELKQRCNNYVSDKIKKSRKEMKVTLNSTRQVKFTTTNYLFGLIKIKTIYNYK